uniref:Uncharacterized protein n=1 Tax=Romanomermis culicivorax TaxID=13658 RepID=A0A915L410_ROMCU
MEWNRMQSTQRDRTKGKFSFGSFGGYRRSFSTKFHLSFPIENTYQCGKIVEEKTSMESFFIIG